ncbi:hypothetical protein J1781_12375 [Rahnella sp. C60]|uniref:hypothetical protein n=1 Tax=Rahnella perminowiae TaxID=2816244 RepID=UPI001C27F607|nr:hypothetical protein [Rahnella perminowiae]MBU9810054.1 hypothetical protein [Rahnella perminowiae]MBU9815645.1 hypothetical protein [Rahnella perminowiae]
MSVYNIYSFKVLADNADKISMTNKVGDLLDVARRNQIVYMQNGDEKTMEANGDAIQTMQALLKEADNFTWTGNAKTNFDLLSESIKNYSQLRAIFHEKSIRSNALAAKLKQNDGQQYLTVQGD